MPMWGGFGSNDADVYDGGSTVDENADVQTDIGDGVEDEDSGVDVVDAGMSGDADMSDDVDAVDDVPAVDDEPDAGAAGDGGAAAGAGRSPRRKPKRGQGTSTFPHVEEHVARKVRDLFAALEDERVLAAAKLLTGCSKSDPAAVVDALTENAGRKKVAAFVKSAGELSAVDASDMKAQLVLAFMSDKNFAPLLFGVLNALAPERGFGRAGSDVMRNVNVVAEKWGDGVDLSALDALRV